MEEGIVRPLEGRSSPGIGSLAVMTATRTDLFDLCRLLERDPKDGRRLFTSRLLAEGDGAPVLVGPMVGAPYAAMVLETLIVWGATRFVFVGWCGSLVESLSIGSILLPDCALIDEGTSRHYRSDEADPVERCLPAPSLAASLAEAFDAVGADYRRDAVWTTDAIFRETPSQVRKFRDRGAVAVEMEVSALYSVGRFRNVEVCAALVVSDDLSGMTWRHGFGDPRFAAGRQALCRGVAAICRNP